MPSLHLTRMAKKKIIIDMKKVVKVPCYVCGQGKGHNKSLHANDVEYVLKR